MNQNFSGPEGVNPYDNDGGRFGKPIEAVPAEGLDFEPEVSAETDPSDGEKLGKFELLVSERNSLLEENRLDEALAKNEELRIAISNELTDREIDITQAAPYNKDCREFDEEHNRKAA